MKTVKIKSKLVLSELGGVQDIAGRAVQLVNQDDNLCTVLYEGEFYWVSKKDIE